MAKHATTPGRKAMAELDPAKTSDPLPRSLPKELRMKEPRISRGGSLPANAFANLQEALLVKQRTYIFDACDLFVQAKERVVELCGQQQTEDETALKTTLKELFTDTAVPEEEANAEAAAAFDSYESALAVHIDPEVLTLCGYEVRDAMDILWCRCMWIVIGSCYLLIAFPESGNQAGKQFVAVWAAVACLLTVNALIHAYYYSSTKYMNAKPHYIDTTRVRAMCVRAMLAWGFFPIVYALCLFVGLMIGNTNAKHLFVGPLCFVLVWLVPCGMVVCMCFSLGRDLTKRADLQGELRARLSRCGASNSGRPMDGEEVSLLKPIATRKLAPEQRLVVELPPADQPSTPMVQVVASLDV